MSPFHIHLVCFSCAGVCVCIYIYLFVCICNIVGPFTLLYFGNSSLLQKAKTPKPTLFITGSHDNFTSSSNFQKKMSNKEMFEGPKEVHTCGACLCSNICVWQVAVVDGVDHFWFGFEGKLFEKIYEWLHTKVLPTVTL